MGYDQNNSFYNTDGQNDQSWRDQTNIYQTPREQPTPMGSSSRGRRKRGWLAGILTVLLVAALCFGVFYVVHNVGVRLEKTEDGFTLSMSSRSKTPDTPEPASAQEPLPEEVSGSTAPQLPAMAEPGAYVGSGTKLNIVSTKTGTDTTFSDQEDALSLQDIYSSVIDSVVSISSMTSSGTASGTGIIMSSDGYIITNHHVISGALVISVLTNDNREYEAALVGSDEMSDLAVLKIDAKNLQAAEFGDSSRLRVGDSVVAIGDPLGVQLRGTMTNGIISAINRDLTVGDRTMTLIQTNAALNNGNSGGPLINCYGQVVGVNAVKLSSYYSQATVEGLGFAIPISTAKPILDELIQNGYVAGRPAIGISGEQLPAAARVYYGLPEGVYVTYVSPTSGAWEAGVRKGDIITAIDGTAVSSVDALNTVKNRYSAGDTVTLTIYRSGQSTDVEITLMDEALQAQE